MKGARFPAASRSRMAAKRSLSLIQADVVIPAISEACANASFSSDVSRRRMDSLFVMKKRYRKDIRSARAYLTVYLNDIH